MSPNPLWEAIGSRASVPHTIRPVTQYFVDPGGGRWGVGNNLGCLSFPVRPCDTQTHGHVLLSQGRGAGELSG